MMTNSERKARSSEAVNMTPRVDSLMTQKSIPDDELMLMIEELERQILMQKCQFLGFLLLQMIILPCFFVSFFYIIDNLTLEAVVSSSTQVLIYFIIELFGLHSCQILNPFRLRIYQLV